MHFVIILYRLVRDLRTIVRGSKNYASLIQNCGEYSLSNRQSMKFHRALTLWLSSRFIILSSLTPRASILHNRLNSLSVAGDAHRRASPDPILLAVDPQEFASHLDQSV